MLEFLESYHLSGLLLGLCSFLIIGLFHPLVIKGEYYFGQKCIWAFLLLAIVTGVASVLADWILLQSLLAVVAFSSLWSIGEVKVQKRRVERGWFPKNPRRAGEYSSGDGSVD